MKRGRSPTYLMTLGAQERIRCRGFKKNSPMPANIKRGESLVRKWGCFGCHDIKGMEKESRIGAELTTFGSKTSRRAVLSAIAPISKQTWDDWTYNKLKTPRSYATERIEQLMPQFDLGRRGYQGVAHFAGRIPRAQESANDIWPIKGCASSRSSKAAA